MIKTIGFFGDSFCAERSNDHSIKNNYVSYIDLLAKNYDAKIVNLGKGGCSVYDTILIQLKPFIEGNLIPDVCIFVWSNAGRLFDRQIRRITQKSVHTYTPTFLNILEQNKWNAARLYYQYLYDQEKEDLEYVSLLNYIDTVVLNQFPSSVKIVHLWSFGNPDWHNKNFKPSVTSYPYQFKTGVEIRPALGSVSLYDSHKDILHMDPRCNHLDGQYKNDIVFGWLKQAIENKDSLFDYSNNIERLYNGR